MTRFRSLKFVAVVSILAAPMAQQVQAQETVGAADIELWVAALDQIAREQRPRALAVVNETLSAAEFRHRLSSVSSEPVLIEKLLRRNDSLSQFSSRLTPSIELVDARTVRRPGSTELDMNVVGVRFGQQNRRLVRLSLPVFSDDGSRALVLTWTAGGFDDASGGGYVFERRRGEWSVVGYLAAWMT